MPVDEQDKRLLETIEASWCRAGELMPSELTAAWLSGARELLQTAQESFRALVEREDLEEIEAMDAVQVLRQRRHELAQCFTRLLDAIEQELLNRRSAQQPLDELTREATHLLHDNQRGAFLSLRPHELVEEVTYAHELLRRLGAQHRRAEELDNTQRALEALEAARRAAGAEGAQAVAAYAELVEGRAVARVCYLAARDLISAALRLDGQHNLLDATIPPLSAIFDEGITAPPLADEAPTQQ
jgi:hypothetical protein